MSKRSQPPPSPTEVEEESVWGDLFGFVRRPPPMAGTPTPAPRSPRQQPNTPKKPSTKRVPRGGGASR
jgi:hypothetical protein